MQQVNLYQEEFYLSRDYRIIGAVSGFALLLLILAIVNIYQIYTTNLLRTELKTKEDSFKSIEQGYEMLKIKAEPKAKDMNLIADLAILRRSNDEKRRALKYFSGNDAGNISGFSFLMQGLGEKRDSINNLWLKKIKFSSGGYDMYLGGSSYQPELLPKFIQALSQEEIYRDREFKEIEILRSEDNRKIVDFTLDTQYQAKQLGNKVSAQTIALFMARLKQLSAEKELLK